MTFLLSYADRENRVTWLEVIGYAILCACGGWFSVLAAASKMAGV